MDLSSVFRQLGIALGLGLLVGLQRERTDSRLAGFRTFPLITVLGNLCGLLGDSSGGWVVGLGLMALSGVIIVGNLAEPRTVVDDVARGTDGQGKAERVQQPSVEPGPARRSRRRSRGP